MRSRGKRHQALSFAAGAGSTGWLLSHSDQPIASRLRKTLLEPRQRVLHPRRPIVFWLLQPLSSPESSKDPGGYRISKAAQSRLEELDHAFEMAVVFASLLATIGVEVFGIAIAPFYNDPGYVWVQVWKIVRLLFVPIVLAAGLWIVSVMVPFRSVRVLLSAWAWYPLLLFAGIGVIYISRWILPPLPPGSWFLFPTLFVPLVIATVGAIGVHKQIVSQAEKGFPQSCLAKWHRSRTWLKLFWYVAALLPYLAGLGMVVLVVSGP